MTDHARTLADVGRLPLSIDWNHWFWRRVHPEALSGCWLWHGPVNSKGYGQMCVRSGRTASGVTSVKAHRFAYEWARGPIGHGMLVCHRCDVPSCVNPDHLFVGTAHDNVRDMVRKGRMATGSRSGRRTRPEATARGERHARAKLRQVDVDAIRDLVSRGVSQSEAARMYGVHVSTVWRLITGDGWNRDYAPAHGRQP